MLFRSRKYRSNLISRRTRAQKLLTLVTVAGVSDSMIESGLSKELKETTVQERSAHPAKIVIFSVPVSVAYSWVFFCKCTTLHRKMQRSKKLNIVRAVMWENFFANN